MHGYDCYRKITVKLIVIERESSALIQKYTEGHDENGEKIRIVTISFGD